MGYIMKAGSITAKDKDGKSIKLNMVLDKTQQEAEAAINSLAETKKTEITNKGQEVLDSIPEDYSRLSESIVEISTKVKWNLADGAEVLNRKMMRDTQTVGQAVATEVWSDGYVVKVPVEENTVVYFLSEVYANQYGADGYNNKNSTRFACYTDKNENFIVGYSYPQSSSAIFACNRVPTNASYLFLTVPYLDRASLTTGYYWVTTHLKDEHIDFVDLADGVRTKKVVSDLQTEVSELSDKVGEFDEVKETVDYAFESVKWNLADGATFLDNTYFVAGGTNKTLTDFAILSNITGIEGEQYLYVYTEKTGSTYGGDGYNGEYSSRGYRFYDADGNMISELISYTKSPIIIPPNAVSCDIQAQYVARNVKLGEYWVTTQPKDEHYDKVTLKNSKTVDDINKNKSEIAKLKETISKSTQGLNPVQLVRKPTFVFTFDDGTDGDVNTKNLFDSYGFKCGFAILSTNNNPRYLEWQTEGFEILSHSINGTAFENITDASMIESYLKNSLKTLKGKGYDITGWVTPSTTMNPEHIPYVEKYYQYAFGHLRGTSTEAYHTLKSRDLSKLERWSLQSNTIDSTMSAINNCITNNGIMIFYGHSYPQTSDNFTVENMKTILDFLKEKVDDEQIYVLTPREAINNYYAIRFSELVGLLT